MFTAPALIDFSLWIFQILHQVRADQFVNVGLQHAVVIESRAWGDVFKGQWTEGSAQVAQAVWHNARSYALVRWRLARQFGGMPANRPALTTQSAGAVVCERLVVQTRPRPSA